MQEEIKKKMKKNKKKLKLNTKSFTNAKDWISEKYEKEGTKNSKKFKEEAQNCYYSIILKNRRKELKMTQEDLAKKVGKKRPYISRVENGEEIKLSNLVTIAQALGLSIEFRSNF